MSSTTHFSSDPGLETKFHDLGDQKYALEYSADCEAVIAHTQNLANSHDGYSPSRELRHVATIPAIIQLRWRELYGIEVWNRNHWPGVKRLLNDPDWRWLRSSDGRL